MSNRRPDNLTIRGDILNEAKSLRLNTSKAAEAGIVQAITAERTQRWLESNKPALLAHNERTKKQDRCSRLIRLISNGTL